MSQANQFRACAVVLVLFQITIGKPDHAPFVLLVVCALADSLVRFALSAKCNGGVQ